MITFFVSPIGLGHATRDVAICDQISSILEEEILIITGKPAADIFSASGYKVLDLYAAHNFDVNSSMELASIKRWVLNYIFFYRKCKSIAQDVMESNEDCKIVSDEDFASIAVGEKKSKKRILITDILETHFMNGTFSFLETRMNKSLHNMIKGCDRVIVPDYGDDKDNLMYVGPIVRNLSITNRDALRKRFEMENPTIVVTIGGTAAGKYLIEMLIKAFKNLLGKRDMQLIVASGPSLRVTETDNTNIRNVGFVSNVHEFIYAADLVVSLAGRSTIDESIVYGTPGIFIPIRNHFEQEQNAKRLGYRYDDIFKLESLIEEKMRETTEKRNILQNGAGPAAKAIVETLKEA